jgi:hypothetical protein
VGIKKIPTISKKPLDKLKNVCYNVGTIKRKEMIKMKIVINGDFGGFGFGVADEFEPFVRALDNDRTHPDLVEFVENHPHECGDLVVEEIPDTATDWEIDEYDGAESVIYVVDGKIYHA